MWNSSIKIDYIAGLITDALDNYSVNGVNASFTKVIVELKEHFPNCSDEEITDIINLCMQLFSSKKTERADLVLTAPDSFRVKALRTKETLQKLIDYCRWSKFGPTVRDNVYVFVGKNTNCTRG